MFLIGKTSSLRAGERGSSMLAVIGLMAVAAVATIAIAGSTMNSLGVSSATRAGVQAQSAAEAGIDDALLKLTNNTCTVANWSTSSPASAVLVSYSTSATSDIWFSACPSPAAVRVKVLATGEAVDVGVGGNTTGDTRTVEAIYAYVPADTDTAGAGSALYSHNFGTFAGSSQLNSVDGSEPVVQVRHGNVSCDSTHRADTSILNADLVIADGGLEVGATCTIVGDVWATEPVALHDLAQVRGNIVAPSAESIDDTIIHGSIWTTGATVLESSAWIKGSVTAGSLSMINSAKIDHDAWSAGETTIGHSTNVITGHLTTQSLANRGPGVITGGTTVVAVGPGAGSAPAPAPFVPDWVDVNYDLTDWPGFQVATMNHGCRLADIQTVANLFTGPGIIDARECPQGVFLKENNVTLSLPQDLAIFADRFEIGLDAQIDASGATPRKLWLISPDETADGSPTCRNPSDYSDITHVFIVQAPVTAMLYTPCSIDLGFSAQWRGQLYGGTVGIAGTATLHYAPVGIPGVDLSTGITPSAGESIAHLGARVSIRDLNG
ncbi:polymer-forming cytoskeletal protein [Cryobacterium sp. Y29]|uniref:polymer-forming cytoskeletal protein n=1 Tax=Cryobacterium sp. Y29 TaxID=2048285 RepID=UPI0011B0393F|nr:polymer-forming cytoskeletal protein [Cryobacterium sp. Y29]